MTRDTEAQVTPKSKKRARIAVASDDELTLDEGEDEDEELKSFIVPDEEDLGM